MSDMQGKPPQPIGDDLGASILGPRNVSLQRENLDLLASPDTDSGTMPNLAFRQTVTVCAVTPHQYATACADSLRTARTSSPIADGLRTGNQDALCQ